MYTFILGQGYIYVLYTIHEGKIYDNIISYFIRRLVEDINTFVFIYEGITKRFKHCSNHTWPISWVKNSAVYYLRINHRVWYVSYVNIIVRCALATTISWFYELIDRQLASETVAQAQRRLVRRKLVNTTARSWRCRPPSLAPNSVLVSRSARSPSSLGATGKKHARDPILLARSAYLYLKTYGNLPADQNLTIGQVVYYYIWR